MGVKPRTTFLWTKGAQEYPWIAECDRRYDESPFICGFIVGARSEDDGQVKLALHKCPYMQPAKEGLLVSRTLLEETWEILDDVVKTLMEGNLDAEQKLRFQGEARGVAKVIQLFMKIYFSDVNAVSAEAKRRYEAARDGREYYTQGLGPRATEFPPGFRKEADAAAARMASAGATTGARASARAQRATGPRTKASKISTLSAEERTAIKAALDSGLFEVKQLCDIYKLTPEDVESLRS